MQKKALAVLAIVAAAIIPAVASADEMTWTITSEYQYKVQLEFYSQSRSHVWPGGGEAYGLNDYEPHQFTLSCIAGEKVCYGAWVTGIGSKYWGVGPDNQHDCDRCCAKCGERDPEITLSK